MSIRRHHQNPAMHMSLERTDIRAISMKAAVPFLWALVVLPSGLAAGVIKKLAVLQLCCLGDDTPMVRHVSME